MNAGGSSAATIEVIAEGVGYAEGPVVDRAGRLFVTSLDRGAVFRVSDGEAQLHAQTGGGANGAAIGADGTIFVAQNGGRKSALGPRWSPASVGGVQWLSPEGDVAWLTREPISPNDLCVGPDGHLYVTDPTRARRTSARDFDDGRIWRVDPASGDTELLLSVPWFTNGIAFGRCDELYVASTYTQEIFAFGATPEGLVEQRVVVRMTRGGPDGIAIDEGGNLVVAAISLEDGPGTIQTWSPDGRLLDVFEPGGGADYTNIAFVGRDLVITDASHGRVLAARDWPVAGLPLYPWRSSVAAPPSTAADATTGEASNLRHSR